MKVSCLQENLARGLATVSRAVATRSTLPITSNVLLATDEGRLRLSATDLSTGLTCWIGAKVEEEGAITIQHRLLSDFINSLPNDRIDISLPPRGRQVRVVCARNEASVGGTDAEDFPPLPTVDDGVSVEVPPSALRDAITRVVFAAANDDSRPVLTGIHMLFEDDKLTMAGADGFRLSVYTLPLATPVADKTEVIVPARSLDGLNRLLGEDDEPVELRVNAARTTALFRLKNVEMVVQLIQGTFPNYSQLIPPAHSTRAVVEVSEFLRETKIASIFARDGSGIVRLQVFPGEELSPGRMVISARADEVGDNQGEIDTVVEGEPLKIAFNGKYLQDVLGVLDGGQVALEATTASSPGVIRPVGRDNYVHVVMPMFVQW